jgi:alpha-L-fucosidase 2
MSVYPLGLIDISSSDADREIIEKSLRNLVLQGSDNWTGYSWAWLGNLYARAGRGAEAADALRTFAECFCLPNSFHVNGDQSGTGKSKMTYRPFTLEGNFAFASGIQEMLLQSHRGMIEVFPAVPAEWKDVSFEGLRAEGAVLVSATMNEGLLTRIVLIPEKGGTVYLKPAFGSRDFTSSAAYDKTPQGYRFTVKPGEKIVLETKAGTL